MLKNGLKNRDFSVLKCSSCRLKTCPIYSSLRDTEFQEIEKIKKDLFLKKKSTIFSEKESNSGLYIIRSGLVKVYKSCWRGLDLTFKFAKPGDVIDLASYQQEQNNVSAECLSESHICYFEMSKFGASLSRYPRLTHALLSLVCQDLCQARNKTLDIIYHPVESRLANFLLYLKDADLGIHLSREEMSQAIGCSIETLIRLVSKIRKKGIIKIKNRELAIVDLNALASLTKGRPNNIW